MNDTALTPSFLRRACSVDHFQFDTTEELPHVREIIGQPRGLRAIEFGIGIDSPGYNVFLLGPSGTGRATAVRQFLERRAKESEAPHDWIYVFNFKVPHKPRAIMLPPGVGAKLREAMGELVDELQRQIPRVLETEEFRLAADEIESGLGRRRESIMEKVLAEVTEKSFAVVHASSGPVVVPAANGQPLGPDVFAKLPGEQRRIIEEQRLALQGQLQEAIGAVHLAEKDAVRQGTLWKQLRPFWLLVLYTVSSVT